MKKTNRKLDEFILVAQQTELGRWCLRLQCGTAAEGLWSYLEKQCEQTFLVTHVIKNRATKTISYSLLEKSIPTLSCRSFTACCISPRILCSMDCFPRPKFLRVIRQKRLCSNRDCNLLKPLLEGELHGKTGNFYPFNYVSVITSTSPVVLTATTRWCQCKEFWHSAFTLFHSIYITFMSPQKVFPLNLF